MNKTTKYALLTAGGNLALFLLLLLLTFATGDSLDVALALLFFLPIFALLIELVVGIAMAVGEKNKEIGAGLLIGVGLTLLIGLSACGIMVNM